MGHLIDGGSIMSHMKNDHEEEEEMNKVQDIYQENSVLVYYFLLSKCKDPLLAEDLTQETFLQAIRSMERYDGSCKLSVWLCQIAKHLLYQHWSRQKVEVPLEDYDWMSSSTSEIEREVLAREELSDVIYKMRQLPLEMRKVVYLRVSEDLSFREIGELLGKTENWARVTFYRAKERLKAGEGE